MKNPMNLIKIFFFIVKSNFRVNFKGYSRFGKGITFNCKDSGVIFISKNTTFRNYVNFRVVRNGLLSIGEGCFFNQNVSITAMSRIEIGSNCKFANNVVIVDHDHDYKNDLKKYIVEDISIGNNVWIGANSVILKGVSIGDRAVIAAGSIVNRNIEPDTIFYQTNINQQKQYLNRGNYE